MPRGFKRDERATMRLFENGLFQDERSALVYDTHHVPHLILRGVDMIEQRERIYQRDAGWCKINGPRCLNKRGASQAREECELHHKKGGLTGRCDCDHNLEIACRKCHRTQHVQTRFGELEMMTPRMADGEKDFD